MKAEKLKQFFEQLRGKGNPTAQDIRNAAAATGNITEIAQEILIYANAMGINIAEELADFSNAREQARQKADQDHAAAELAVKAGELAAESAPEKRRELVKSIRSAAVSLEPPTGGGFQFVRMDSLEVRPPSWLVKGLIETDCFGCLYGDPAAGKSFMAIELASCVATGTPFYSLPVTKGPVIFLAGEGQSGLARRFKAWSIARDVSISGAPLFINRGAISLIDGDSMLPVIQALERLILEIGRPPALVILDTWSRVLGGDDSAPSDAAAGVTALDDLRARFGNFAALVVHHEGHTKGRGRGWSGLRAAVDVELRAERGIDGVVRLECTKAKDIEPMAPMAFHFSTVELGFNDENGEPVTSAVLTPAVWTSAPEAVKKPAGKNQNQAMDILKRLAVENKTVTLDTWREACLAEGMIKQRFNDVKKTLAESGKIGIDNLQVTILSTPVRNGFRNGNAPYYIGGRYVTLPESDTADKVTEYTETLLNVTNVTAPELFQDAIPAAVTGTTEPLPAGVPPGYEEHYNSAVFTFMEYGRGPEQARREAIKLVCEYAESHNGDPP